MLQNGSEKDESIDTLDARSARALTEYMSVLPGVGRARDAPDLYLVVSQSGREYLVDARMDACECADARYRDPDGGCKHARRVAYATGARAIPAWADADAVDPDLGAHVAGGPRVAATDGGQVVADGRETDATGDASEAAALDRERAPHCPRARLWPARASPYPPVR